MENELMSFRGIEVREDNNKVCLKDVALCCGLTQVKNNKSLVRWKSGNSSIVNKLNAILSGGTNVLPQHIVNEINITLQQIEEIDDRNNIYISRWLAKRIATECKNKTAMEFKNWLVSLDEARENGQIQPINNNNNITIEQVQNIITLSMTEVMKQLLPIINESKQEVNRIAGLIHDQSEIYDADREELKSMIGLTPRDSQEIGKLLINREKAEYNKPYFYYNNKNHIENRNKLLGYFGETAFCRIPKSKFKEVKEKVLTMDLVPYVDYSLKKIDKSKNNIVEIKNKYNIK